MKKFFLRLKVRHQLRATARHLNDLDNRARDIEVSRRYYAAKACRLHCDLLALSLKTRVWR